MSALPLALIAIVGSVFLEYLAPLAAHYLLKDSVAVQLVRPVEAIMIGITLTASRRLRSKFPLNWAWTWLIVIFALPLAQNIVVIIWNYRGLIVGSSAAGFMDPLAIAFIEEFFFRGVWFLDAEKRSPKVIVLCSASAFAISHLIGHATGGNLLLVLHAADMLPFGILFGMIRLATGSIAWCVLTHGLVDATGYLAYVWWSAPEKALSLSSAVVFFFSTAIIFIAFFIHPAMKQTRGGSE